MAIGIIPVAGNWYQNADQLTFEVVTLNEDEGIIEVRYFDGELGDVEFDVWSQMRVEKISPPGDWMDVYDELDGNDLDYGDLNPHSEAYAPFVEDFER